jgi:hypothetical protein
MKLIARKAGGRIRRRRPIVLLLLLASFFAIRISAQPSNDTCAGAQVIPASGPFPFVSIPVQVDGATTTDDPSFTSCGVDIDHSIWYTFTPAESGLYTLSTAASTPTETTVDQTMIAVFTSSGGCAGTFTLLPTSSGVTLGCAAANAFAEIGQATLATQLTGGTQYFIGVWVSGMGTVLTPHSSAVQLSVERNLVPSNDTCAGVIPLTINIPKWGTTKSATDDYRLPGGSGCFAGALQVTSTAAGRETVYSFTAPSSGTYELKVVGDTSGTNPVLYTSASCPSATPPSDVTVSCTAASNRTATSAEHLLRTLSAGQTEFIFVDDANSFPDNFGLDYFIQVTSISLEVEANNTPATSNDIACGLGFDLGSSTDIDMFQLGGFTTGSRLFAMVDGGPVSDSLSVDLRLVTATDTLEYDRNGGSPPFGEAGAVIAGGPLSTAQNYLRVNRDETDQAIPGYRVYSTTQSFVFSAITESEPNGTLGTSDAAISNYFYGTLDGPAPSTDLDMYRTSAVAGQTIFVAVDGDPIRDNSPISLKVALLDPDGHTLVQVHGNQASSSTNSGAGSLTATTPHSPGEGLVFQAPVSGTYYVRIETGTTSSGTTGAGDYLLSISKDCIKGSGTNSTMGIDAVSPPAGRTTGGQQIVLTGNFSGLSSVKFGGTTAAVTNNTGSQLTVTTPAHVAGAVTISLVPTSGTTYQKFQAFAYLNPAFTDEPLVASVTNVNATHLAELRTAVDALRAVAGLSPAPWTDSVLQASTTPIKAVHIQELRTFFEDAVARLGYSAGSYTDPALGIGTSIKREHIEELRARIETLAG